MDDEFVEYLEALSRRDLDLDLSDREIKELKRSMKSIASTSRLAYTIAERPENIELYSVLAKELQEVTNQKAFDVFERTGLNDIFDSEGPILFSKIQKNIVPKEDLEFLRESGVKFPEEEIAIVIMHLKSGAWAVGEKGRRIPASHMIEVSKRECIRMSHELSEQRNKNKPKDLNKLDPSVKPRKIFNGIGKLLSGVVAGTGNVLIGAGAIPASGGAATAGVIASGAFSIGMIFQGIGDLRGE